MRGSVWGESSEVVTGHAGALPTELSLLLLVMVLDWWGGLGDPVLNTNTTSGATAGSPAG